VLLNYFMLLILGIATTIVGAIPFGLVNLTVLNVSFEQGHRSAMRIAHGASVIEVLFGLTAIVAGGFLHEYIKGNATINYLIITVLGVSGIVFILKRQRIGTSRETGYSGFFKGAFLNLISIQVFLFWMLAIAFLSSRQLLAYDVLPVLIFVSGIWIGKMLVLLGYMKLSKKILSRSQVISKNINTIIGIILLGLTFVQMLKL